MAFATIAAAGIAAVSSKQNADKAGERASKSAGPRFARTGNTIIDRKKGFSVIDPRFRETSQDIFSRVQDLSTSTDTATQDFQIGLQGIRERLATAASDFDTNQGAFAEAQLAPIREEFAIREGNLEKDLGRTGVRGSFAQQSRDSLARTKASTIGERSALVEDQRIKTLSNFLGMDANLLKAGLASETGRTSMLSQLEAQLAGINQTEFDNEIAALRLIPGTNIPTDASRAAQASSEGVAQQAQLGLVGEIFKGFDKDNRPTDRNGPGPGGR